jgi:hypothetical protein
VPGNRDSRKLWPEPSFATVDITLSVGAFPGDKPTRFDANPLQTYLSGEAEKTEMTH